MVSIEMKYNSAVEVKQVKLKHLHTHKIDVMVCKYKR